jgi:hypothetical protein
MLAAADEQLERAEGLVEKVKAVDAGIEEKIAELRDLVSSSSALKRLREQIK